MTSLAGMNPSVRRVAESFLAFARANGVRYTVTSAFRSKKTQLRLYQRYKAGLSRFPAAPPGRSSHERGLAFDINLPKQQAHLYGPLGRVWESAGKGFVWGGRFKDPIHFEYRP